ncbi:MAG: metallophosphoesterase [Pisciglobus halotolerans]|nr:metallophosphoesterase [Pisciglobus halotolerans]
MKKEIFAIGDVHGEIGLFKKILSHWRESTQQFILMGDLGDRGENPKACFLLAKQLVEEKGAVCLRGNHEEMLLSFLQNPIENQALYLMNGGKETIESFLYQGVMQDHSGEEISRMLRRRYPFLEDFLNERPYYAEWGDYIFVHAGVDLKEKEWKKTSKQDFVWIREGFYDQKNSTGKTIVFGHTITPMLHGDNRTTDIWIHDNMIGIDGGAVYGGVLHGIVFNKEGIVTQYHEKNKSSRFF